MAANTSAAVVVVGSVVVVGWLVVVGWVVEGWVVEGSVVDGSVVVGSVVVTCVVVEVVAGSALVTSAQYSWPIWVYTDAILFGEMGGAFDEDLGDVSLDNMALFEGQVSLNK